MSRVCRIHACDLRSARLQLEPLRRGRGTLRRRGWTLAFDDARPADVVALQVDWRTPADDVTHWLDGLREQGRPVVFLDHFDATATPYPQAIARCDRYLKKQLPQPLSSLATSYSAGSSTGNELAIHYGFEPTSELCGDAAETLEADPARVQVGWNVGASDFVRKPLLGWWSKLRRPMPWSRRPFDVNCIAGVGPPDVDDWYSRHRHAAVDAAHALPDEVSRLVRATGPGRPGALPKRQYERSFGQARLVVSPFGYGEICYRDFEAIAHGALLVKPRMPPMTTQPDVFREGETYAACAWDFGDLAAVVAERLADAEGSAAMAARAREELRDYHRRHAAAERFADVLDGLMA